jgi:preprotein translocase SecF subunit
MEYNTAEPRKVSADAVREQVDQVIPKAKESVIEDETIQVNREEGAFDISMAGLAPATGEGAPDSEAAQPVETIEGEHAKYWLTIDLKGHAGEAETVLRNFVETLEQTTAQGEAEEKLSIHILNREVLNDDQQTAQARLLLQYGTAPESVAVATEQLRSLLQDIEQDVQGKVLERYPEARSRYEFELGSLQPQAFSDDPGAVGGLADRYMIRSRLSTEVEGKTEAEGETREIMEMQEEINAYAINLIERELLQPQPAGALLDNGDTDQQIYPSLQAIESIGKAVASDLRTAGIMSVFLSLIVIFVYILLRFDFSSAYGMGAVLALFHDVSIVLGAIVLFDLWMNIKIDLNVIAALLTIVGYSLNDTIVVYDRIRENRHAMRGHSLRDLVNISLNQTLGRTLLTSLTTLVAVLALFIFGGSAIRALSFPLLIGVLVGTYSSLFIASPTMLAWTRWQERRAERMKKAKKA